MNCTCSPRRSVVFATPAQQMSDQHGSWEMKLVAGFAVLEMSFNYRGSRGHNVWLTLTAGAYARFHVIDMASVRSTYQVQLPGPEGVFFGPHRNGWDYVLTTTVSVDWYGIPVAPTLRGEPVP